MSVVPTSVEVRYTDGGKVEVWPSIRLDARSQLYCFTYEGSGPVLVVVAGNVRLSLSVPDHDRVSVGDVARGRELAEVVSRYVAELERRAAATEDVPGESQAA